MGNTVSEFHTFKAEQEILDRAELRLKGESSDADFKHEFEELVSAYKKLFKISRRLVRTSDLNEERLKEANIRITAQQKKLENEILYARTIQMSMVPGDGNVNIEEEQYRLYALLQPARSVGGDFYSYQQDVFNRLHFIIGDVSDKGVPAALFMAKTVTLYNNALNHDSDPGKIFTYMNNALCQNNDLCMFVTALCGYLDLENGELVMSNAGHNNPVLRNSHMCEELVVDGNTALGLFENIDYPVVKHTIDKGAQLLMYTDGITEAKNTAGKEYEERRLLEASSRKNADSPMQLAEVVMQDVDQFVQDAEQFDDITLLIIQSSR